MTGSPKICTWTRRQGASNTGPMSTHLLHGSSRTRVSTYSDVTPARLRSRSHNESYAPFDTAEKMDFGVFGMT